LPVLAARFFPTHMVIIWPSRDLENVPVPGPGTGWSSASRSPALLPAASSGYLRATCRAQYEIARLPRAPLRISRRDVKRVARQGEERRVRNLLLPGPHALARAQGAAFGRNDERRAPDIRQIRGDVPVRYRRDEPEPGRERRAAHQLPPPLLAGGGEATAQPPGHGAARPALDTFAL